MLIHPFVVHFPIALWLTAAFFDVLAWRQPDRPVFREAAYWLIGIGALGGLVSIAAGWMDLLNLEAQGVGTGVLTRHWTHSMSAYLATAVFLGIFTWRWRTGNPPLPPWALYLTVGAALLVAATGYLGGDIRQVM
ncbi:MAG TPA: DUF2231 domain-containing protein [bacterium]|nr:DUF2231 domain-containing protein [bacterium]